MQPNDPYTDIIMNVAVYLAARFIVVAEIMKPILQKIWGHTTCSQRSLVLSECQELQIPRIAAKTYGGAERRSVVVRP
jgi:hypothetical protein